MTASTAPEQMYDEIVISLERTSALIFDLDGTMVDNMMYHHRAWQEMLRSIGYDWTLQEIQKRVWGKNEEIIERLFPGRFSRDEARELTYQKELQYIECYRPHIKMIDGLERLLRAAQQLLLPMAVATAAPKVCVEFVFDALGLNNYIDVLVQADDVAMSKPHPETFLTAAAQLGKLPDQCIVFEDAPVGVRAAEAAEMESYVLLTTHRITDFQDFKLVRGFIKDYSIVRLEP